MFRTILAGVLAMSFAFANPQAAEADGDVAAALVGLLFLYGLAEALDDDDPKPVVRAPKAKAVAPVVAARKVIPAGCVRTFDTAEGQRRIAVNRCLERNYAFAHRLPQACTVRTFTTKGWREGYRPRCLRRQGFTFG